jgi:hypothetical protein
VRAVFDEGVARISWAVEDAARAVTSHPGRRPSWVVRLRAGLVAFLGFLDDEPQLADLLLGEAPLKDGLEAARCRQRLAGVLTGLLDDGEPQAIGELVLDAQLTGELVAGGVLAVVRAHVHEVRMGEAETLVELAPSLMSFVVAPYLGEAAARSELIGLSPVWRDEGEPSCTETSSVRWCGGGRLRTDDERASRGDQEVPADGCAQTGGVGGPPWEGSRASFDRNREDKGVVDK